MIALVADLEGFFSLAVRCDDHIGIREQKDFDFCFYILLHLSYLPLSVALQGTVASLIQVRIDCVHFVVVIGIDNKCPQINSLV